MTTLRPLALGALMFFSSSLAVAASQQVSGTVVAVREYRNGVQVSGSSAVFLNTFSALTSVEARLTYDPLSVDLNPQANVGQFLGGGLEITWGNLLYIHIATPLLELGTTSGASQDEVTAYTTVFNTLVGSVSVGGRTPQSTSLLVFGSEEMLAGDALPVAPLDWNYAETRMTFVDAGSIQRELVIGFASPVPEASSAVLWFCGVVSLYLFRTPRRGGAARRGAA